jgi:hypothetical protein
LKKEMAGTYFLLLKQRRGLRCNWLDPEGMDRKPHKPPAAEDARIEQEIRSKRKFSIAEAIGREGGALLKGASPVTLKRQAELQLGQCLGRHLDDAEGALEKVLVRLVRESEILLSTHYADPLPALLQVTEGILRSEARLRRLVRAVDAEWGRIYSERPYFDRPGSPPHRKDPYTVAVVREALTQLLEELKLSR